MAYPKSDHSNGKKFHNLVPRTHGFLALLRWITTRDRGAWNFTNSAAYGPKPLERVPAVGDSSRELRVTFVNHTTFLIQWMGLNILTDPVWSERASPVQWTGPRRVRLPGIRFEDVPNVDVVLLSHDHYDHMDRWTIAHLAREHRPKFLTGLGNARRLRAFGVPPADIVELDWRNAQQFGPLTFTCVPAQHFSGRTPFDRDSTLWCGFMISPGTDESDGSLYFAGDTGFGPHFQMIADRFPNIRASILPIGAFRPEWFMGEVHCSPRQAVEAHQLLRSRTTIASHFGTFPLADDAETEAPEELQRVLTFTDLGSTQFILPEFGKAIDIR